MKPATFTVELISGMVNKSMRGGRDMPIGQIYFLVAGSVVALVGVAMLVSKRTRPAAPVAMLIGAYLISEMSHPDLQ